MKLICWNLHALPFIGRNVEQRMRRAAAKILDEAPDLVLLQEIWTAPAVQVFERTLNANYLVLTGEHGSGRHCGGLLTCVKRATWSVSGPTRFTQYRAQGPAWKFWQGDGLMKKGVLATEARHLATGRDATILNTHLQSQYGSFYTATGALRAKEAYVVERGAQLRQLEDLSLHYSDRLVMIGGDFNTTPDEWPELGLPKAWQDLTASLRTTSPASYVESTGPLAWYDYVFAQPSVSRPLTASARLIENTAVDVPYSDHHGLVIDLDD